MAPEADGCGRSCADGSARNSTFACGSRDTCTSMGVHDWLYDLEVGTLSVPFEIVEVSFKGARTGFFRNERELELRPGDHVVVEADRGVDLGTVHMMGELVRMCLKSFDEAEDKFFPKLIRIASLEDLDTWSGLREEDAESFQVARVLIAEEGLPMKLVDVEWQFDRNKVTFYFTADHRVDFRELVRKLARRYRIRVELRQIGARDEAARLGGVGSCGRELCCSTWLRKCAPVSTHAARNQNIPLHPVRLSGRCGRLKCCLNYELEQYMQALRNFPSLDTNVQTSIGEGVVRKIDIFKQLVWIKYPDGNWDSLPLAEVNRLLASQDDGSKNVGGLRNGSNSIANGG